MPKVGTRLSSPRKARCWSPTTWAGCRTVAGSSWTAEPASSMRSTSTPVPADHRGRRLQPQRPPERALEPVPAARGRRDPRPRRPARRESASTASARGRALVPILTPRRPPFRSSTSRVPQWSPDGSRIAFTLQPAREPRPRPRLRHECRRHRAAAGVAFRRAGQDRRRELATWSPDGTRIAFNRWVSDDSTGDNRLSSYHGDRRRDGGRARGRDRRPQRVPGDGAGRPTGRASSRCPATRARTAAPIVIVDATTGAVTRPLDRGRGRGLAANAPRRPDHGLLGARSPGSGARRP